MSDYLDAKADGVNFLTGAPWSPAYRELAAVWSKYPMYDPRIVKELLEAIDKSRVVLVTAGTGSGKTVITPKVLLRHLIETRPDSDWKVGVTNPKTVTTFANAEFAAKCLDVPLGQQVGYAHRGAPPGSVSEASRLVYMTDGYLLAQTRADPTLSSRHKYAAIVLDEAHERPVPVDMLLLQARKILETRQDFKVVIMSATIDAQVFVDYFQKKDIPVKLVQADGAPRHRVEARWIDRTPAPDAYMEKAVEKVAELLRDPKSPTGDILVFVPTIGDTRKGCERVRKETKGSAAVQCHALHSKISAAERAAATAPSTSKAVRKVVFATNVAESSITLDGIVYVIDTGLQISSKWDPETDATVVKKEYTTQSQIRQREGRVGRTAPGVCIHLYTKDHLAGLKKYPDPVISTIDFTEYVLQMLSEREGTDEEEDFFAGDSYPSIQDAVETCEQLLTPPTAFQMASAISYLDKNCLLTARAKDGSPIQDYAKFKTLEALKAGVAGKATVLGRIVNAMHRLKLSIANTLMVVAGMFYEDPEVFNLFARDALDAKRLREQCVLFDCIAFACIAEVAESESGWSSLWRDDASKASLREALEPLAVPKSDHATLVNVYKALSSGEGGRRGALGRVLDLDIWNKIVDKVGTVGRAVGRFGRIKSADSVRSACKMYDLKTDGLTKFEKCLLTSRIYNVCGAEMVPVTKKGGAVKGGSTVPTVLRVRNFMPLVRRTCSIDGSQFSKVKEVLQKMLSGSDKKIVYGVYESITSLNRSSYDMDIITVFEGVKLEV